MCTDLPFSVPLSPVSCAVPCGAAPSSHQLCRWRGSRALPVRLSRSVWPLSPRASPYSHPQSHVMTLGLTHLGRGHIPYSAPHFLTRVVPYGTLDGGLKRSLKIQRLVCNFEYSNLVIQCMTIQPCWLDFFFFDV